eukprot:136751-Rhodomonas_salina.1
MPKSQSQTPQRGPAPPRGLGGASTTRPCMAASRAQHLAGNSNARATPGQRLRGFAGDMSGQRVAACVCVAASRGRAPGMRF